MDSIWGIQDYNRFIWHFSPSKGSCFLLPDWFQDLVESKYPDPLMTNEVHDLVQHGCTMGCTMVVPVVFPQRWSFFSVVVAKSRFRKHQICFVSCTGAPPPWWLPFLRFGWPGVSREKTTFQVPDEAKTTSREG